MNAGLVGGDVEGVYRYVRYQDVFAHEDAGWRFAADLGRVHGQWSVLMWHCECGEVQP